WALGRVAHAADGWLDLEDFLIELWSATGERSESYWGRSAWDPGFDAARNKHKISAQKARSRAFWLDAEGKWAANALMGTLAYLGLLERGPGEAGHRFRLTPLGTAVFGAPDLAVPPPAHDPRFLTVQPNYDVQAYLDVADASAVWPLAQMARQTS